jgi:hypothetical protein
VSAHVALLREARVDPSRERLARSWQDGALMIDWGTVEPDDVSRARVGKTLARTAALANARIALRHVGSGYEARIDARLAEPIVLRLHAETLFDITERVSEIIDVIERASVTRR